MKQIHPNKEAYSCPLCGNGYSFTSECPHCLGSLANKALKHLTVGEMRNEIAKIDSLNISDQFRVDVVDYRKQLLSVIEKRNKEHENVIREHHLEEE